MEEHMETPAACCPSCNQSGVTWTHKHAVQILITLKQGFLNGRFSFGVKHYHVQACNPISEITFHAYTFDLKPLSPYTSDS